MLTPFGRREAAFAPPLSARYRTATVRVVREFRILGPLDVRLDGQPVGLGGPKQRATLAILLLNANRVVSIDRLADSLYAGSPPVTAVTQVQRQISELRKALGSRSVIETRAPGYVVNVAPEELDLTRFERLTEDADRARERGDIRVAGDLSREALELWRSEPLADLVGEPFAVAAVRRLEELRLAALEQRVDSDLALGRHGQLIPELEQLVLEYPLRERLRAQLMLAFYRSGRQADALDAYRAMRASLVEGLGIEPTPALRELERAILAQDRSLELTPDRAEASRALLAVPSSDAGIDALVSVGEPLLHLPERELILARLLADEREVEPAARRLQAAASRVPLGVRTAAFTTTDRIRDLVRLATACDVELVLVDAPPGLDSDRVPTGLADLFERSPADVGVVTHGASRGEEILVPFGGGDHDWAALELAAAIATAAGRPLGLVGTKSDVRSGRGDASRMLADASLAVQRLAGVPATPLLADPTQEGLVSAVAEAWLVVVGIAPRWRDQGIGATRRALVRKSDLAVVIVHGGPRPGALAPRESRTRYTWSVAG
jgi:DNA-binding SARP family transcriptional activator